MKYKLWAVSSGLLLILCMYLGWLVYQDRKPINTTAGDVVSVVDVNYDKLRAEKEMEALKNRITNLEKTKAVSKPVVIDKEEECKRQADKYFTEFEQSRGVDRSTYTSHWNTNLTACMMDIVVRETNNINGSVSTLAIVNLDITNNKVRNNCVMEAKKGEALSCEDSIFLTFREGLMTQ